MNTTIKLSKYIFFAIMILNSCKKGPEMIEGTLNGLVIDQVTKEPVAGAKIIFRYRDKCHWSDFDDCYTMLDSTSYISDSDGRFVINYRVEDRKVANAEAAFGAKPYKDGYFYTPGLSNGIFLRHSDSLTIAIWPMTYLRVRIIDENPDPDRKYDGIRLNHTSFVLWDSIFQRPLDTTIIMVGNPFNYPSHGYNTFAWALFYLDHPQIIGPISTIPQVQCPPHDTCDLEIRF